jgi:RNase P subunit RPR2
MAIKRAICQTCYSSNVPRSIAQLNVRRSFVLEFLVSVYEVDKKYFQDKLELLSEKNRFLLKKNIRRHLSNDVVRGIIFLPFNSQKYFGVP